MIINGKVRDRILLKHISKFGPLYKILLKIKLFKTTKQEASLFEFSTNDGIKLLEINQTSSEKPRLKLFKVNCDIEIFEVELDSWNTLEIRESVKNGQIFYQVKLDDQLLVEKINRDGQAHQDVNVFQGSKENFRVDYKYFEFRQLDMGMRIFYSSIKLYNFKHIFFILGVLISGGASCESTTSCEGEPVDSVEIWSPLRGQCTIPSSNITRVFHTLDGIVACGGYEYVNGSAIYDRASSTCETFVDGKWIVSHTLLSPRFAHISWNTDDGIYLIGGASIVQPISRQTQITINTTEKIMPGNSMSQIGFDLKYPYLLPYSCLINLGDSMILPGGFSQTESRSKISRYNKEGWVEDLPDVDTGISVWQSCSYYTNSENKRVCFLYSNHTEMMNQTCRSSYFMKLVTHQTVISQTTQQ